MPDLAIIDALAAIETDPDVIVDSSGEEPDEFEVGHLYVFSDEEDRLVGDESGPQRRLEWTVMLVFVGDAGGEEPTLTRSEAVTEALSTKRDAYLAAIADRDAGTIWDHAEGEADMDWTSSFEGRAVAVRVRGYTFQP